MLTSSTLQAMIKDYLTGPEEMKPRYWHNYKERWWRLIGNYGYKGKRDLVLSLYLKRRTRLGKERLARALAKPSLFETAFKGKDFGPSIFSFKPKL